MILTVTPNPALDLGGSLKRVVPDEKNYVRQETRFPGGNGINAARVIHALGVPVCASGFLGGGIGEEVRALLERGGVPHDFVPIRGHTRISVTVSNEQSGRQTRLSFPGPSITRAEAARLRRKLDQRRPPAALVLGGSLPPGYSASQVVALMKSAARAGIPCVADFPGKYLSPVLRGRPFLIKPNLTEYQELLGRSVTTLDDVRESSREVCSKVPLVCVSSVEGGAVLATADRVWFGKGPKVKARSTVGAGDSMVGAMTARLWHHGLLKAKSPEVGAWDALLIEDVFRWGLAAAMATVTTSGTELGTRRQMSRFVDRIHIRRV